MTTTHDPAPPIDTTTVEVMNNLVDTGTLWSLLSMVTMGGFPLVRAIPVRDATGTGQPALDVQIDYGAGWVTPWKRLLITVSPDQHEDGP